LKPYGKIFDLSKIKKLLFFMEEEPKDNSDKIHIKSRLVAMQGLEFQASSLVFIDIINTQASKVPSKIPSHSFCCPPKNIFSGVAGGSRLPTLVVKSILA